MDGARQPRVSEEGSGREEVDAPGSLQHINIVEILGYSWDHGSDVLIVMEYLEEGSLNYYLKFQGDKLRISHLLKYAPESAVEPWHFSTKSDVWSYGVTAWEIFTRARHEVPRFDVERPRERAACFQIPEGCPSEIFRHLMKDCWALDPNMRPKFIDLIHMCKRFIDEYK
ncbi:unnamed protein product [Leptidea sinapis]|uniref:Protein kinase domain-containing protein n=1 Tax=Leptidea sinapis TaxID=189913 RepID=A0A5E4R726_9NEOP|nr:unnamed protein product [Leptidea sinapis]